MNTRSFVLAALLLAAVPLTGHSTTEVSGLLDIVFKNSLEDDVTNTTFKSTSNLHTLRSRLFFDADIGDNNAVFVQLLTDNYAIDVYGAYVRLTNVIGPYVNLHAGLIPSTVGNFGPRTYSTVNPLVGVPLLWNHHSSYAPALSDQPKSVDDLLVARDHRTKMGLPVLYDNCWNTGVEFYGSAGQIDYSLGVLAGSVSKPTLTQNKDIPQVTTRLVWIPSAALAVGLNGFAGPYLFEGGFGDSLPAGKDHEDYLNYGGGYDLAFSAGYFEIHSELFYAVWETPYLGDLQAFSGYAEAKYKLRPGWYAAARLGFFEPNKLTSGSGSKEYWDYPVRRVEFGVGYHPTRTVVVKLASQLNRFNQAEHLDEEHYLLQLSIRM